MKIMWCWRCRQEMPMLDEDELARVARVYRDAVENVKAYRREIGAPLKDALHLYEPVGREYEAITGVAGVEADEVMRHSIRQWGPPCTKCGKLLRTPTAKLCAACWTRAPGA